MSNCALTLVLLTILILSQLAVRAQDRPSLLILARTSSGTTFDLPYLRELKQRFVREVLRGGPSWEKDL
jgi:hypothetical protein